SPTANEPLTIFVNHSFTNAEIPENHIKDIFDIDPAGEPPQRRRSRAQFFGDEFLSPSVLSQGAIERRDRFLQRPSMAYAGNDARLRRREIFLGIGRKRG